jgi:hypothetical protein
MVDGSVSDADIRSLLLRPHADLLAGELAGVSQASLDNVTGSIRFGRPFSFGQAVGWWYPVKRILLYLASQTENNPVFSATATTAALLSSWDRAAHGWSLQVLIHESQGRHYLFLRGNQALIKHPELASDGGVIRGDFNKSRLAGQGGSGGGTYDGQGSGGGPSTDPWQGKSDPWKGYQKTGSWSTGSKGWHTDKCDQYATK